ncbi:MAG: hypothetical protein ACD_63C00058G0004, partial [uncultured bacterium]
SGLDLFKNPRYDTWHLATIVLFGHGSYSLEALTKKLGIEHFEKHRAYHDARAGMALFLYLLEKTGELNPKLLLEINEVVQRTDWPLKDVFNEVFELRELRKKSKLTSLGRSKKLRKKVVLKNVEFNVKNMEEMFKNGKDIAVAFEAYEYRPSQVEMMKYVSDAFVNDKFLLVEAPPGVGKSMAYLLPAIYFAKAKEEQLVISTYTLNLQNQLYKKDIPALRKIVSFDFESALLKGRKNYVCLRLFNRLKGMANLSNKEVTSIVKILVWLARTETGDFDEVAFTREDYFVQKKVASDKNLCYGRKCPNYKKCFVNLARSRAKNADIIIVNHSLLLSEPAVDGEKIFEGNRLIIDEAHELENAATDAFGKEFSKEIVDDFLQDLSRPRKKGGFLDIFPKDKLAEVGNLIAEARDKVGNLYDSTSLFFGILGIFVKKYEQVGRYMQFEVSLDDNLRLQSEWMRVEDFAKKIIGQFDGILSDIKKVVSRVGKSMVKKDLVRDLASKIDKGEQIKNLMENVFLDPKEDHVYWITIRREKEFLIKSAPKNVGEYLRKYLYCDKKTIIMTSATLSTASFGDKSTLGINFDYFSSRLSLEDFEFERVADVFDYKKQALVYIPKDIALPDTSDYMKELSSAIIDVAKNIDGRTMVLFTSYTSIRSIYEKISGRLKASEIDVFAQGIMGGKAKILQQFTESGRAVLLGTSTFWQGVNLDLQCLIIAKLPFAVPTEPVFAARQRDYENGFTEYAVPNAIIKFRQGFGRLIRSRKDKGVVLVMDKRVESGNYGLMFLRSLPKCNVEYGSLKKIPDVARKWFGKVKN